MGLLVANIDKLENPPFLALSDRTRYRIFLRLLDGPAPVKVIAADLPISQPAVSQHLKTLKAAGLITERREGRTHIYAANATAMDGLAMRFSELRDRAALTLEAPETVSRQFADDYDTVDFAMADWSKIWPGHDPLTVGLIVRLRIIARQLEKRSEATAERFNLSNVHVLLLATLDRIGEEERTLTELSKISFMSLPATAKHLAKAEKLGLVRRRPDENDARSSLISISERGRVLIRKIMESQRDSEHAPVYQMSLDDKVALAKLLKPLLRKLAASSTEGS